MANQVEFNVRSAKVSELLDGLAQPGPVPAAGVAALTAAAMGAALLEMVARLTLQKQEDVDRTEMESILAETRASRERLLTFADQDARVAASMVKAMGKGEAARTNLAGALIGAARVPLAAAAACHGLLHLSEPLVQRGYAPVAAEAATAAALIGTAGQALLVATRHNLQLLPVLAGDQVAERYQQDAAQQLQESRELEHAMQTLSSHLAAISLDRIGGEESREGRSRS